MPKELPPDFVKELKRMTVIELAVMRSEFKLIPEDKIFLDAVDAEIKERATQSVQAHK